MCGITGIISKNSNPSIKMVNASLDKLTNRGPDDRGIWISKDEKIILGHTRLSIQDITNLASQPMLSKCGKYIIIYNGEIYNLKEIKEKLPKEVKSSLSSSSDTEVLLNSLIHNGIEDTCKAIDGMFGFVFFKIIENKIYIARDKFGEKPLYYSITKDSILFASTVEALNIYSNQNQNLDKESIAYYLRYGYIKSTDSIYKNIKQISTAEFIEIDTKSLNILSKNKYWNIYTNQRGNNFKGNNSDFLFNVIEESVRNRLIGDVDVGCFLSGGFDSSLIGYFASKLHKRKLKTFSIGFNEKEFDESENAREISNFICSEHYEYKMGLTELLKYIPEIAQASDQPFADSSFIPTLALCKLSSEKVKVCLSGDGADEIFGGYERYRRSLIFEKRIKPYNFYILNIINILNIFVEKTGFFKNYNDKLLKIKALILTKNIKDLYEEISSLGIGLNISRDIFRDTINFELKKIIKNDHLKLFLLTDLSSYLNEDILVKSDRASMHYSLEVRSPFLNTKILDHASNYKSDDLSDMYIGKKPLREISSKIFPKNMILKKKKGFSVPLKYWLQKPLRQWSYELINDSYLSKNNFIEKSFLLKIYDDHQEGRRNWAHQIWAVLMFEDWYRNKINN